MAFIQAENYRFFYPDESAPALSVPELRVEKGSFCLVAGASGSGKTTLLRQLSGEVKLQGQEQGNLISEAENCAYVWQNPDGQIVTDQVEYEIVFGLENRGMEKDKMIRRLAEVVTFFGLENLMSRDTMELSGGEMQILNVAAAVATGPDLLLLDEPASQLDPVSARRLYELLRQINEESGITILLAEQRLEEAVALADSMILLRGGELLAQGTPESVFSSVRDMPEREFFPLYARGFSSLDSGILLSKKEARIWFEKNYREKDNFPAETPVGEHIARTERFLSCRDLYFRYDRREKDVLAGCSCEFPRGKIIGLAGGNGSGKTTFLQLLTGRLRPYRGKIRFCEASGKETVSTAFLPQQPRYLFLKDTAGEEWEKGTERTGELAGRFGLLPFADRNPADLSGGELERLALCRVLGEEADCYLLDEPTTGLNGSMKEILAEVLAERKREGKTILIVSHDMEFAAAHTDIMAFMFRGRIELVADTRRFFEENQFYTTAVNRIARGVSEHIIIWEDVEKYAEKKTL